MLEKPFSSFSFLCSSPNLLLEIPSACKACIYSVQFVLTGGIANESLNVTLSAEFRCQNVVRELAIVRVESFIPKMLIRSV